MKDKKTSRIARAASAKAPSRKTPTRRILVADDNSDIRRLNVEVLVKSGYEVDAAEDGAAAWYNLQLKRYDLLITDHDMPHVTGFELLKKLRAARMALPVIMAAETLPQDEFASCPWIRPSITLLHPYTTEEFLETVEGVLQAAWSATEEKRTQASRQNQSNNECWLLL